jgi:hypothetical protein
MYQISVSPAVLSTCQRAVTFFHQLKNGAPQAWDGFQSPEVESIRQQWGKIKPELDQYKVPSITTYMTGAQLRHVVRALFAYVAAQDGRYSLLCDYLSKPIWSHPDPFLLVQTLAEAEIDRRLSPNKQLRLAGLSESDDALVRNLLAELNDTMTPPGQALAIHLPDYGIARLNDSEMQLS